MIYHVFTKKIHSWQFSSIIFLVLVEGVGEGEERSRFNWSWWRWDV